MISVLFVDDDAALCDVGKLYLERNENFRVDTAESARSALKKMHSAAYDAIVSDYQMPGCSGIDLLKKIRSDFGTIPFILFTGKGREEVVIEAINNGADFYLHKGGHATALYAELGHKIQQAVGKKRIEALITAIQDLSSMITSAASHREALSLCLEAAIDLTGLDSGGIYIVDENTGDLNLVVSTGFTREFIMETSRVPEHSKSARLVQGKKPVYLDYRTLEFGPGSARQLEGLKAAAIIPILHSRKIIGCFNISSHVLDTIPDETRKTLEMIVSQVGNSIARIVAEEALRESEQRYRNVVEDQTEFICRFLPDGTHVFVNEAYCRFFNRTRDEIIGHRFTPDIPAEDRKILRDYLHSFTPDHPAASISHRIILPDGTVQWQRWSDRAIFDEHGRITEYQSVGRDITEQKQVEEALRESEQKYRNVVEDQTEFISRFLPDGTHVFVNEAYCRCFGKTRDEIIGHRFLPDIPGKDLKILGEHLASLTPDNPVATVSHRIILPDGTVQWQRWSDRAIFDEHGRITEYQSVGRDITEQKRVEEALRESEQKYRNVVEDQTEFICRFLPDGTHVFVNEAYCRCFDKTRDEIIGHRFLPDIPGKDLKILGEHLASLTPDNPVATVSHRIILPDGTVQWQRWSDRAIFDEHGRITEYQSVGRDITEQKQVEEALRNSETIQRQIIEHLPDPTMVIDKNGVAIAWNRALELLTDTPADEIVGKGDYAYSVPFYGERRPILIDLVLHENEEILKKYHQLTRDGQTYTGETIFARPQGKTSVLWGRASPLYNLEGQQIGAIESIRDITERKREEERARAISHKLSLLSDITRHDILNQVQVLKAYLELSSMAIDDKTRLSEYIEGGKSAALTIESQIALTREFQDLGRNSPGWMSISGTVREAKSRLSPGNISIGTAGKDREIYADPLFEKVIYNLFDNSLKHGGPKLTRIQVSSIESNGDLLLVCEDDGDGIRDADKNHIFEKGFGKNNGLGLFLSREILAIGGMTIKETGIPGEGARFEISVPAGMHRSPAGSA